MDITEFKLIIKFTLDELLDEIQSNFTEDEIRQALFNRGIISKVENKNYPSSVVQYRNSPSHYLYSLMGDIVNTEKSTFPVECISCTLDDCPPDCSKLNDIFNFISDNLKNYE